MVGMTNAGLRAIFELSDQGGAVFVGWSDNDRSLVRYDIFLPSDETADGTEEVVVDVLEVSNPEDAAKHGLVAGQPGTISSADPPTYVASPDGAKEWKRW